MSDITSANDIRIDYTMAQELLKRNIKHDWNAPDVQDTPKRFVNMLRELTTGKPYDFTTFDNPTRRDGNESQMVIIKNINFVALCAHHIIPFIGKAHIGYIPDKKIAGLSKFSRAVKYAAAGLWTQEELTHHIASYLDDELEPLGVIVMLEAEHMCMTIRGVQDPGTQTITTELRGICLDPAPGRDPKGEFLELIKR